jgi:hypothetical protein
MPKVINLTEEKINRAWEKLSATCRKLREGKDARDTVLGRSALTRTQSKRARERRQEEKQARPRLTVVSSNRED